MRIPRPVLLTLLACLGCRAAPEGLDRPSWSHPEMPLQRRGVRATHTLDETFPSAGYPLRTCVVSGEALDSHGERTAFRYDDEEVQFCRAGCVDAFLKQPEKYLAAVRAGSR